MLIIKNNDYAIINFISMAFLTFCKRYNDRSINILIKGPFWLSPERVFLVVQCAFMTDLLSQHPW